MNPANSARPGETGRAIKVFLPAAGIRGTTQNNQDANANYGAMRANHSAFRTPHSTLTLTPRNIHSTSGWLWQEKSALRTLGQYFSGPRLLAARSIYLALTEIASNQFTPARAHTSCAYLGSVAGCSESSVRRYLREFVSLSLVAVEMGIHQANTYILLGEAKSPDALAAGEMPLADGGGRSRTASSDQDRRATQPTQVRPTPARSSISPVARGDGRSGAGAGGAAARATGAIAPQKGESRAVTGGTPDRATMSGRAGGRRRTRPAAGDSPAHGEDAISSRGKSVRAVTVDHPTLPVATHEDIPRAVTGGSQIERIKESKNQEQQTDGVVVVGSRDDAFAVGEPTAAGGAGILIPAGQDKLLTDEQQAAAQALTGIGIRKSVAAKMAATHPPADVRAWVRYAIRQSNLKSRAGFVLTMLAAGEAPPAPISSGYVQHPQQNTDPALEPQPEPPHGLTEVLAEQGTVATTPSPSSARDAAIWQAAQERLRDRVSGAAWGMWLQHVRLVAVRGDLVQLASPAVGAAETFERRYAGDVREVLGDLLGRAVEVEFMHRERLAA